jgi:hypothetical protein
MAALLSVTEEERRRLIELYATERLGSAEYIDANRALDEKVARVKRERAELAGNSSPQARLR